MQNIKQEHGTVIELSNPLPGSEDKTGSLFIYDSDVGVWFLKATYDKLDMEEENFSSVPYLCHEQLGNFGQWEEIGVETKTGATND